MKTGSTLLFSVAYDPGWHAWVDGRPTATQMLAPALVGVTLRPGAHHIMLRYVGFGWYPELWAFSLLSLVGLAFAGRRPSVVGHNRSRPGQLRGGRLVVGLAVARPAGLERPAADGPGAGTRRTSDSDVESQEVAGTKKIAARQGRVIVFIDESGLSERPCRARTWAPKGQTPVLQYSFSWKQLSVIAGLSYWRFTSVCSTARSRVRKSSSSSKPCRPRSARSCSSSGIACRRTARSS